MAEFALEGVVGLSGFPKQLSKFVFILNVHALSSLFPSIAEDTRDNGSTMLGLSRLAFREICNIRLGEAASAARKESYKT